ncbi:Uncharacterized protein OBRU01_14936 [Operophtera brumata]|uniref:Gag-like protein n=1 Tax=Operophtera brumata TaxID=104452 RepID=A0A0L7KW60_OPEBR|nr:Uncharacterized protein OBRU01_19781 [Operophtera brumata]KOB70544.1 Uncharacterized protein OBRU01_14936 [Operophtera brumata]
MLLLPKVTALPWRWSGAMDWSSTGNGLFNRPRSASLSDASDKIDKPHTVVVPSEDSQQDNMDYTSNSTQESPQADTIPPRPNWQKVPTIRTHKRQRISDSPPQIVTETSNSFAILPTDSAEDSVKQAKPSKPPPLILYGIEDVNKLTGAIQTVIDKNEFTLKLITQNQLRVNCSTVEAYKSLMSIVREMGLIGHTFTRKEERCYRVVIRNLHHSTPHEAIIEEIEKSGNKKIHREDIRPILKQPVPKDNKNMGRGTRRVEQSKIWNKGKNTITTQGSP